MSDAKGAAEANDGQSVVTLTLPTGACGRGAAGLCRAGAASGLSHRRRHGHGRRSAAQPRQIGHGGIEAACRVARYRAAVQIRPSRTIFPRSATATESMSKDNIQAKTSRRRPSKPSPGFVEPHPHLFSDRADRRRSGGGDHVADLVVRDLGRQSGAADHSGGIPAGNLSAGQYSGHRSDHRLYRADAARLPHRQFDRPQARRFRRKPVEPHADRAADLPHRQADFRDLVLEIGIRVSAASASSNSRRPACGRWCF